MGMFDPPDPPDINDGPDPEEERQRWLEQQVEEEREYGLYLAEVMDREGLPTE